MFLSLSFVLFHVFQAFDVLFCLFVLMLFLASLCSPNHSSFSPFLCIIVLVSWTKIYFVSTRYRYFSFMHKTLRGIALLLSYDLLLNSVWFFFDSTFRKQIQNIKPYTIDSHNPLCNLYLSSFFFINKVDMNVPTNLHDITQDDFGPIQFRLFGLLVHFPILFTMSVPDQGYPRKRHVH